MKIVLNDVRLAFNTIVERAIELGFLDIETDTDWYWTINEEDRIDFKTANPNKVVGSLVDDYTALKKLLDGENPPNILDFDRIANIVIEIGNSISKSKEPYY